MVGIDAGVVGRNILSHLNVVEGFRTTEFECNAHPELRPQPAF